MNRTRLLRLGAALLTAAVIFLVRGTGLPGRDAAGPPAAAPAGSTVAGPAPTDAVITQPGVGFRTPRDLVEHYAKHSAEFGNISKSEYLRRAQLLRDRPARGDILEAVRADGVITRFDRSTGDFLAVNPDGVIRTYFRPNAGEAYFRRQVDRGSETP